MPTRVFLLSPARCAGKRAATLAAPDERLELARRLHDGRGLPIGEAFSFVSGLYFRGKLDYARAFARVPAGRPGALVITPTRGLQPIDRSIGAATLAEFAAGDVDPRARGYREPLERSARALSRWLGTDGEAILLGSIATDKYLGPLLSVLGERLLYPGAFGGRGSLSRGALLLRSVRDRRELAYLSALESFGPWDTEEDA